MKITTSKLLGLGLGAAALCASALPAAAASFTQPGATTGAPAGFNPPPGLYFINVANYGVGGHLNAIPGSNDTAVGVEVPIFVYVPGWNFLGATYAASVAAPLVEVNVNGPGHVPLNAAHDFFNPYVNPVTLSWAFGNGFGVSIGEGIYIPVKTTSSGGSSAPGLVTSAASFETRGAISYIGNDWILSQNGILGIVTKDAASIQQANYIGLDQTVAHTFGKWTLGAIGYEYFDINSVAGNTPVGRAVDIGFGGMLGYNFGVVDLTIRATHEVVTKGGSDYGAHETRVWGTIVIPIWNPTPPAPPRPVVAKY